MLSSSVDSMPSSSSFPAEPTGNAAASTTMSKAGLRNVGVVLGMVVQELDDMKLPLAHESLHGGIYVFQLSSSIALKNANEWDVEMEANPTGPRNPIMSMKDSHTWFPVVAKPPAEYTTLADLHAKFSDKEKYMPVVFLSNISAPGKPFQVVYEISEPQPDERLMKALRMWLCGKMYDMTKGRYTMDGVYVVDKWMDEILPEIYKDVMEE